MPEPTEYREEGQSQEPAHRVGYYGHLDPGPTRFFVYLAVFSVVVGIGLVAWLGWSWLAIGLIPLAAVTAGVLVFRRGGRGGTEYERHYDEARTKTVEYQAQMHLDSKGPIGF